MIGGSLVQVDWRWVFWINLPVGVVAVVVAMRMVPESRDRDCVRGGPTSLGAALLAAAVGLVALALVKAPDWGWGSLGFVGAAHRGGWRAAGRWWPARVGTTPP